MSLLVRRVRWSVNCRGGIAAAPRAFASSAPPFHYQDLWEVDGSKDIQWRKLEGSEQYVSTVELEGQTIVKVKPEGLRLLAREAMKDMAHLLRPAHLKQLAYILKDPEASSNDRFVALELLKNANVAAGMRLPSCQDTGTGTVIGKRGQFVWTDGNDEAALSHGIYDTYTGTNLRYSQMVPLDMYKEKNTGTNLPAQIDLYATSGNEYKFMFIAKGGGSANKTQLFQKTKALLKPESLMKFLLEQITAIGTAACPPYHLSLVIGGLSADQNIRTVKYAATKFLDNLHTSGNEHGRAFRDLELEEKIHKMAQDMGMGAQFGGKYFAHDVRVIRLPRHAASCPVGLGVSCSADRQAEGKITAEGIFLEALERDPVKYLPEPKEDNLSDNVINVNLNRPMAEVLAELTKYPVRTRLSLTGTLIVARDVAHAKLQEKLDSGEGLPQYMKDHAVYYAGPAKTPDGMASGSFGPTTAGRMDSYVDSFQANGGSMVMLAKGNRSRQVTKACHKHGGFYLGSIGGPAAILAANSIKHVEVLDYADLGMEAVWKIKVENFPAFIVVDDKGEDFFKKWQS